MNIASWSSKNNSIDMSVWYWWSTGICARGSVLNAAINGICKDMIYHREWNIVYCLRRGVSNGSQNTERTTILNDKYAKYIMSHFWSCGILRWNWGRANIAKMETISKIEELEIMWRVLIIKKTILLKNSYNSDKDPVE